MVELSMLCKNLHELGMQAITMDEDAEVEAQQAGSGLKSSNSIPAGAMLASPGDLTNRKISLERLSEAQSMGPDPPLVPAQSGELLFPTRMLSDGPTP